MKKQMTPSRIEPATFRLVAQCLNCVTTCTQTYVKVLITKHEAQCMVRCPKVTYCCVPNKILSPYAGFERLRKQRGRFILAFIYVGLQVSESKSLRANVSIRNKQSSYLCIDIILERTKPLKQAFSVRCSSEPVSK